MRQNTIALSLLAVTLVAPAFAATNNPVTTHISIELRDGSRVVGVFAGKTLVLDSASVGELQMPVERIRVVEWPSDKKPAQLQAANGDKFAVELKLADLPITASFGEIKVPVGKIRQLRFWTDAGGTNRVPGLVALWSGEGDARDSAGGNNGTLSGNATFAQGKVGQAFRFDGVGGYAKIPQSPNLNFTDQITIAFWMKADANNPMNTLQGLVTSDYYSVEISGGYGGRMGVNFALSTTANQPPMGWNGQRRVVASSANFIHISDGNNSGAPVTSGEWHHIAATYDGTKLRLYVDGQSWGIPVIQTGDILPMLSDSFVAIGSEDGRMCCPSCVANRYFKGLMDEVSLYNRALTADEIRQLFEAGNTEGR